MENLKIKVNDEAESKEVQELLSYLGYNWRHYLLTNEKMREETCSDDYEIGFLFAELGGNVSCLHKTETKYFDDHPYKEITLQKLKDLAVLKRNSIDDATNYYGGNFNTSEYADETNKMINCKIRSTLRKIHKLKRENLVLSDRRKSVLQCKSNFNNAKYHYYCKEDFQILFNTSERIGKNGNKIQRLRTKISQLKKSLILPVDE